MDEDLTITNNRSNIPDESDHDESPFIKKR